MARLIKNAQIIDNHWPVLKPAAGESAESLPLPDSPALLPLALWLARKDEILARRIPFGIWLESNEGPETLAADLEHFPVIGVNFPKFTDGRGYSTARLLRERFGYEGELRAVGDVLADQIPLMRRCGFSAFVVVHEPTRKALRDGALAEVSIFYQPVGKTEVPVGTRPYLRRAL